jgi:hypothetical protein
VPLTRDVHVAVSAATTTCRAQEAVQESCHIISTSHALGLCRFRWSSEATEQDIAASSTAITIGVTSDTVQQVMDCCVSVCKGRSMGAGVSTHHHVQHRHDGVHELRLRLVVHSTLARLACSAWLHGCMVTWLHGYTVAWLQRQQHGRWGTHYQEEPQKLCEASLEFTDKARLPKFYSLPRRASIASTPPRPTPIPTPTPIPPQSVPRDEPVSYAPPRHPNPCAQGNTRKARNDVCVVGTLIVGHKPRINE